MRLNSLSPAGWSTRTNSYRRHLNALRSRNVGDTLGDTLTQVSPCYMLMNGNIKLVIFDLDGTLVDAYQAVAGSLNYTLAQMDRAPVDGLAIKRAVGWGDRHLVGTFVGEGDLDRALSIFRQHHAHALRAGTGFLPGARQLLDELKGKGYALVVASNRPTRFTRIILKHLRIHETFDYVLCGDKVAHPKPAADILERILGKFSLSPGEALYIGDMTVDVETGQRAGVKTVAVLTGSSTRGEIARLKPFRIIDRVLEAAKILEELNFNQHNNTTKQGRIMGKKKRRGKLSWRSKKANHGTKPNRG